MIQGTITKIMNQTENDWGRYMINDVGKETIAVGIIPNATIGMEVSLEGKEERTKYGLQFNISSVVAQKADECAGIRHFFYEGYVKGIGPSKANAIITKFGIKSLNLFETPEGREKLATVKGLSKTIINKALPSYEENKKYKDIILFLNGSGTKNQIDSIMEKYGASAIKVLKKNPYRLQMDLTGFGFAKTDKLALSIGIKPDSIYRIMAAIKYSIEEAQSSKGHCYLTVQEISDVVIPLLVPIGDYDDITKRVAQNAIDKWPDSIESLEKQHKVSCDTMEKLSQVVETRKLIENGLAEALSTAISEGEFVNIDGKIYTKEMYTKEKEVAEMISVMCKANPVRFIDSKVIESVIKEVEERKTLKLKESGIETPFLCTKEQRDAVYLGLMHRISIISGGPGRGKTAISEIIALGFLRSGKFYDKDDIIMIAPTGRAAQRITESTGYNAMTAHRAILMMRNNHERPKNKLILCDESSMVDIYLMHSIMTFAKDCNLIFVGDVDQIASVGPGKVLKDMIDSGKVPCILLKEGHRNSGSIATNSVLINEGKKLDKYCYDEHFVYYGAPLEKLPDMVVNDYINKTNEYGIQNVLLCAAMRERGDVSVNKLNKRLQDIYTKGQPEARYANNKVIFRVGDRVMQTKNDYNFIVMRGDRREFGVFNGEKGTVVKVIPVPEDESYNMIVRFDDGSLAGYTRANACNLTLAYATTLHKCQGSEAPCVIMVYTFGDYMLLNRSLFYTGETRAKNEFRFFGEEKYQYHYVQSAFDVAVSKCEDIKRNTSLCDMIKDMVS